MVSVRAHSKREIGKALGMGVQSDYIGQGMRDDARKVDIDMTILSPEEAKDKVWELNRESFRKQYLPEKSPNETSKASSP